MAGHSDEEALDNLLSVDRQPEEPVQHTFIRTTRRIVLAVALSSAFIVVALYAFSVKSPPTARLPASFEEKVLVVPVALGHQEAFRRNDQRKRMVVEQDLKTLLHIHVARRQAHYQDVGGSNPSEACLRQAERLFDEVAEESAMDLELRDEEFMHFRRRFASAMQKRCKDLISERLWLQAAGEEIEKQKPVVTSAVVAALNTAGLGFTAKMHDWLLHETAGSFSGRLGLLPTPEYQKSVLKRQATTRQASDLPMAFRADLRWPECKEVILRIHNQGHCGSCWAFGGLASIDARMCIASDGKWDDPEEILSRLHVTSCAPNTYYAGSDGCQGGWPHWPMEMMARTGIASTSCLPYYISGEGTEHFEHKDTAPPCETHCQGGYSKPLANDTYSSAGIANYDWITHVHGDLEKMTRMKDAIYQEGPVAFAFFANHAFMSYSSGVFSVCTGHDRANHAVYAFGWGVMAAEGGDAVEYVDASNSWGRNWGADGHFRISPTCITDVTIAGTIESSVVNHRVGSVDPNIPRDPDNEYWPWAKPDECPFVDGCVTDMEGSSNYSNNEICVSKRLNGKRIRVHEFATEMGYDTLHVNGRAFTGTRGAGLDEDLDGLLVGEDGLRFESDLSVANLGFKLCEA